MSRVLESDTLLENDKGATAVEFALIFPFMVMLFIGIACFSVVLGMYSALQQIAAESARAALAGLSPTEQNQIATQYVTNVIGSYGFLNPANLTVATSATSSTFEVTLTYNAAGQYFASFGGYLPAAPLQITRSATIQLSGFQTASGS
jgi:Flp pilus assembly protein TadG